MQARLSDEAVVLSIALLVIGNALLSLLSRKWDRMPNATITALAIAMLLLLALIF